MNMYPTSARSRISFSFAFTIAILIFVYSGCLFYLYRQDVFQDLDQRLRSDFEIIEMNLEKNKDQSNLKKILAEAGSDQFDRSNWLTEVWTLNGERIFTSGNEDQYLLSPIDSECRRHDSSPKDVILSENLNVRVLCRPSEALPDQFILRVARLTEAANFQLNRFLYFMKIGAPLVIILSALMGFWLAQRVLRPIQFISEKAKLISAEKLNERLPVENPGDELGKLAMTFNQTFERLEHSFNQMRRFTSDASHELRTPLSAIRTMGEVALRQNEESHAETISGILEETARLQALCESLLFLSKADAGAIPFQFQSISLSRITHETVDFLQVLAEEKNQMITAEVPNLSLKADPHFLKQAILNLVDNAIKYTPNGGRIQITAQKTDSEILLKIKDNGPGIALEHQARIFDRFYRVNSGRARIDGGAGLGLAITQWIVTSHRGRIEIVSSLGEGTEFILHFLI